VGGEVTRRGEGGREKGFLGFPRRGEAKAKGEGGSRWAVMECPHWSVDRIQL
jgi:hypothetical protein